jgi:hypothetical protein
MMAFASPKLRPDVRNLYAARALRGFGDGFAIKLERYAAWLPK